MFLPWHIQAYQASRKENVLGVNFAKLLDNYSPVSATACRTAFTDKLLIGYLLLVNNRDFAAMSCYCYFRNEKNQSWKKFMWYA